MSEKTELPTPRRLERARKEGQFARSRLASGAAAVVAGGLMLSERAPATWLELEALATGILAHARPEPEAALWTACALMLRLVLPVALAAALASLAASALIAGVHLEPGLVLPRADRLSFISGLGRIVSAQRWMEPLLALGVAVLLFVLAWSRLDGLLASWHRAVPLGGGGPALNALGTSGDFLASVFWWLCLAGIAAGLWARQRHARSLLMSHEEVRREHQQAEGDPQHKAHRKAMHRQLLAGGAARGLQSATAVIVNPTHIAVALRWAPDEHEAPYLVAKGREADALALRGEAGRLGIPVIKDIPLARSLVPLDVGEAIPEELYRAAAAVLAMAAAQSMTTEQEPRSRTP